MTEKERKKWVRGEIQESTYFLGKGAAFTRNQEGNRNFFHFRDREKSEVFTNFRAAVGEGVSLLLFYNR